MKDFEKFGCRLNFFYFLNPFFEIFSALFVLMLIEADCSYYRLDLGLSQIGHIKMHKNKKKFLTLIYIFSIPKTFIPLSYILYLVSCKNCVVMF